MKTSLLGHKRIPSKEGVVEIVVEELASRTVALGYAVTCYNRTGKRTLDKKEKVISLKEYNRDDVIKQTLSLYEK